jgi:hypothetical protein
MIATAQNSRETNTRDRTLQNDLMDEELFAPRLPGKSNQKKDYKKRKKKGLRKVKKLTYGNAIDDYRMRMQAVAKRNARNERLARKPRYSDPSYFGHKRPPKKRPVGKRKLCKECMIVH